MRELILALSLWVGSVLGMADVTKPTLPPSKVKLVAVGDIMLGRSVNTRMQHLTNWSYPFEATAGYLSNADITFGNLEAPLAENCPLTDSGMIFCADTRAVAGLSHAGFDVLSLANNHSLNQGSDGLLFTQTFLSEQGIAAVTEQRIDVREVNQLKVVFLALDDVSRSLDTQTFKTQVAEASSLADIVVASIHWGSEYTAKPSKRQIEMGHALIDEGVTLVLGHHPHWIQPSEEYKNGLIVYSLGNFVFDQMWSEETRLGQVGEFVLTSTGISSYQFRQIKIFDYAQPRFIDKPN